MINSGGIFYVTERKVLTMKNIIISDLTLLREEGTFSFKESIEIARQLENLKLDVIEMPKIENIRKDTLLIKTISAFVKQSIISVDVGATKEGIENAANALISAAHPRLRISLPLSDVGMEYSFHKKGPAMVQMIGELVKAAKEKCEDVEFCAMDATRADKNTLKDALKCAAESGASTITLCDHEGVMLPDEFMSFVDETIKSAEIDENIHIGVLCSDTNGMAAASSVMALKGCADLVKVAVNANVTSLETMVNALKNCGNNCGFNANVNFTNTKRVLAQIEWIVNGGNAGKAVAVSDGVENENIMLDSNDDISAVAAAINMLGYDLSEDDTVKVFDEFKKVAAKKTVGAKELEAIIASVALQVPPTYKLASYVINSGNLMPASAQIKLDKEGEALQGIAVGDGPIDASFRTVEQIIGHHYELDDFQIHAVTQGREAMGSVLVKLRNNGKLYSGKGISTDIIEASIRAYINALNKIVYEEA